MALPPTSRRRPWPWASAESRATKVLLNAGGFSNQVSANEFPDNPVKVNVGDKIVFSGTGEIHTATFPRKSYKTTPFITSDCELPGGRRARAVAGGLCEPGTVRAGREPKGVPADEAQRIEDPAAFVSSGLLAGPVTFTFVAAKPGKYTFVCLVHGPEMSGVIKVR